MISLFISMIVLINPFALFVYLLPVMKDLTLGDFFKVLFKASIISFFIFVIFSQFGEYIFGNVFSIQFESFRIFGGLVIVIMALVFIIQGKRSFITLKGTLDDLASEIAMPFLVGAATISISILIGKKFSFIESVLIIGAALLVNYGTIVALVAIKEKMPSYKMKVAFEKFLIYLLRINGFLIGAIGVDMTIVGIKNVILL